MEHTARRKVVVLGAGYAGVMSANRLAGELGAEVEITLVNPIPYFVERIRLHEVAARHGSRSATRRSVADLLHPDVRVSLGTATRIRPVDHEVDYVAVDGDDGDDGDEAAAGVGGGLRTLPYNHLIYAIGSGAVPGPATAGHRGRIYPHTVSSLEGANALNRALDTLGEGRTVLVVGGGTTAIETVTEIAVARPELSLKIVTLSVLGPTLSAKARRHLTNAGVMRQVEVVENSPVAEVTEQGVITTDGRSLGADCVVWAASFAVPPLAADSGLGVDRAGRLTVDDTMRSTPRPDILGAGDAAVVTGPSGRSLRMACATAAPQGAHAAATVIADLRKGAAKPFALRYLVLAMSLGPGDGLVQLTHSDDSPRDLAFRGRFGALLNELNNRYARLILSWERRRAGSYHWAKPRADGTDRTPSRQHGHANTPAHAHAEEQRNARS